MITSSKTYPERQILAGVPRIGFDIHLCPFLGALDAYLKYVGDPQDYDYLMGISGAAFRRLWNRDDGGNIDLAHLGDEPFRRVFDALGYAWRQVPAEKETMIQAIKASLAQGRPAITFGIIGPPEAGLVAGYAEDGAVLYGWSYFQDQRERYYEQRDWFETMSMNKDRKSLILVGDRLLARPAAYEVLAASLRWALDLAHTARRPNLPEHLSGLAAYDAWADALEVDADYPVNNDGMMGARIMIHGDQYVMIEERHEAARFLRRMKRVAPQVAADHLEAAATLYDQIGDSVTLLWPWPIDPSAGAIQALADARTRRALARHVRAARDLEAEAIDHLERALANLG